MGERKKLIKFEVSARAWSLQIAKMLKAFMFFSLMMSTFNMGVMGAMMASDPPSYCETPYKVQVLLEEGRVNHSTPLVSCCYFHWRFHI
jgi:hypothetical protein